MELTLFSKTTGSTISESGQVKKNDSLSCLKQQRGFALIAALIASVIMLALGIMVIQLSTQDLRSTSAMVGEKKALIAADTGINQLLRVFDPLDSGGLAGFAGTSIVDENNAPGDRYTIGVPALPTSGPTYLPISGYSIGGGQSWGQKRYNADVMGENVNYDTEVKIAVGVGYGPIEISTMSR
jgi:hypothetical protein